MDKKRKELDEPYETTIRRYLKNRELEYWKRVNLSGDPWDELEVEDAILIVSVYIQTGLLDPSRFSDEKYLDAFFELSGTCFSTNSENKIKKLNIILWSNNHCPEEWRFHTKGLAELLQKFNALEKLVLESCSSFWLWETVAMLPNLKALEVYKCHAIDIRPPQVQAECESDLEKLVLWDLCLTEKDFASFLFDTIPFVPKLSDVTFESNHVHSFEGIVQRLLDNDIPTNRLRVLNLGKYTGSKCWWLVRLSMDEYFGRVLSTKKLREEEPNWEMVADQERGHVQIFLNLFRELQTLIRDDCPGFVTKRISPQFYQMEINYAGRVLVENETAEHPKSLPLSVWPKVLARAWKWKEPQVFILGSTQRYKLRYYKRQSCRRKCKPTCDGIYYLLQNAEVLRAMSKRKPKGCAAKVNDFPSSTIDRTDGKVEDSCTDQQRYIHCRDNFGALLPFKRIYYAK